MASDQNDDGRLRGWEHLAHRLGSAANATSTGQRLQYLLLRGLTYRLAFEILGQRILVDGLDELTSLKPDGGVIVVSNHRTFFDLFAILLAMVHRDVAWTQTFSFPVRSRFFYDSPVGTLVNMGLGGGAMFPPIFREAGKAVYNNAAVDYLTASLKQSGHIVGIHPEGTRNRGADPYVLLPAQPGVGKIALLAKPMVVTGFINGLGNNIVDDIRVTYTKEARRSRAIVSVFGAPVDYSALAAEKPRPTLYKKCADLFMAEVKKLSVRERELRADVMAGRIPDDDPRWIDNWGASKLYAFEA